MTHLLIYTYWGKVLQGPPWICVLMVEVEMWSKFPLERKDLQMWYARKLSIFRYHWGFPVLKTAVPPMSCPLPRWSRPVIYKVLLPYSRWFQWLIQLLELLRDSVKASVDTVSLLKFCLTLLFYSLYSSPGVDHSLINFTYHYP